MRQIVGCDFGCIIPIKNEKFWKSKKIFFFFHFFENYALVCKGHACYRLFSYIIIKLRHGTNCWSWFWVYNSNQKWKILKIRKKKNSVFFWKIFFLLFWFLDSFQCINQTKYLKLAHFLKIRNIKLSKNWKKF